MTPPWDASARARGNGKVEAGTEIEAVCSAAGGAAPGQEASAGGPAAPRGRAHSWAPHHGVDITELIDVGIKIEKQHDEPASQIRPAGKRRGAKRARPGQRERKMA